MVINWSFLEFTTIFYETDINPQLIQVGDAFEEGLRLDSSGACYAVIPDCPIFDYKNPNLFLLFGMATFGRVICHRLALRSYGVRELFIFFAMILFLFLAFFKLISSIYF